MKTQASPIWLSFGLSMKSIKNDQKMMDFVLVRGHNRFQKAKSLAYTLSVTRRSMISAADHVIQKKKKTTIVRLWKIYANRRLRGSLRRRTFFKGLHETPIVRCTSRLDIILVNPWKDRVIASVAHTVVEMGIENIVDTPSKLPTFPESVTNEKVLVRSRY